MFFSGPHCTGRLEPRATPLPSGPRHCGQFSASAARHDDAIRIPAANVHLKRARTVLRPWPPVAACLPVQEPIALRSVVQASGRAEDIELKIVPLGFSILGSLVRLYADRSSSTRLAGEPVDGPQKRLRCERSELGEITSLRRALRALNSLVSRSHQLLATLHRHAQCWRGQAVASLKAPSRPRNAQICLTCTELWWIDRM